MEGSRRIKWREGRDKKSQSNAISTFVCTSFVSDHQRQYYIFNKLFELFPVLLFSLLCACGLSGQQVGWKVYRDKNLRPMKAHFSECWLLGTGPGHWHVLIWVSLKNCFLSALTWVCMSFVDLHTTLLLLGCETRKLSLTSNDPGEKEATGPFSPPGSDALTGFQRKQVHLANIYSPSTSFYSHIQAWS